MFLLVVKWPASARCRVSAVERRYTHGPNRSLQYRYISTILDLSKLASHELIGDKMAAEAITLNEMEAHAEEAARLLRSLGNPHRLLVLCMLSAGEMSVGALNDALALSQSALSQHLAVLREEGLVSTRREGQTIFYSMPEGPALQVLSVLNGIFCEQPRNSRGKK